MLNNEREERRYDPDYKPYKINYYLNLLPQMGRGYFEMMATISDPSFNNIEIFTAPAVISLIQYKKDMYSDKITNYSALVHITYVVCFTAYLTLNMHHDVQLMKDRKTFSRALIGVMYACNSWACAFDVYQLRKVGWFEYAQDPWNYLDWSYIIVGYCNLTVQFFYP